MPTHVVIAQERADFAVGDSVIWRTVPFTFYNSHHQCNTPGFFIETKQRRLKSLSCSRLGGKNFLDLIAPPFVGDGRRLKR